MIRTISTLIISLGLLLISTSTVAAQVVINEINASGEWVELFKTGSGAVPLEGCTIFFHNNDSQKKVLTATDNFLESELYKVIATGGNYLNNTSSDTVLLDCPDFDDGPVVYPDNIDTDSYARVPNGTGSFIVTENISQGLENPNPTPTPSPSPTPAPTQAATSAPTASLVPTATPAKTTTPVPTKSPTPKSTKTPTPEAEVLGEANTSEEPTPESTLGKFSSGKKFPFLPVIFIGSGVLMIGFAVYNLARARKNPVQS